MADKLSIDFETRSTTDLKKAGVYRYVQDPLTDIWCMAYAFDDEEPQLWLPGQPVPPRFRSHIVLRRREIRAWNAAFERVVWWAILGPRYGFPVPQLEQFVDTAAEAAAMSLPRKLGQAATALKLSVEKDTEGNRLAVQMAKPRKPRKGEDPNALLWWDDEDRRERLYAYCLQDVRTEREVAKHTRRLPPQERRIYLLDQRINDRGVKVDMPLVQAATTMSSRATKEANRALDRITDGEVTAVTKVKDIAAFCGLPDVKKDTVRDLLLDPHAEITDIIRQVLTIRQDAGKASASKLQAFIRMVLDNDRICGLLLYHGAGTGRWAGRGVQPQNFPRPTVKDIERFIGPVMAGDYDAIDTDHPVLHVLASLLRSMITASDGHRLMGADFAQIEARVLAWVAEQNDLVELFASGGKIYERMAARIYGVPIEEITKEDPRRQTGKDTVLGCGFQMGAKTFAAQAMVKHGIFVPEELAVAAVDAYRDMNHRIKSFWWEIERAAMQAVRHPGRVTSCGRQVGSHAAIRYLQKGKWLWCVLPSGRSLAYAYPVVKKRMTSWGKVKEGLQFMGVSSKTRQWCVQHAYGGFLTENVVQAMARDLMASAMLRVEKRGYPVVLTVHDEVLADVPNDHGTIEEYTDLMQVRPRWAAGLPVEAEAWEGERYRK